MKLNKKKVFTLALAVCLIAILSMGTLAWFTDTDSVKNDFMIAGSENGNPDEIFSVDVWEDKDGDGNADDDVAGEGEGLIYENILPGDELTKNVFVKNTGAYDQYIRVIVVVTEASAWMKALNTTKTPELTAIVDLDTTLWDPAYKMYDAANDTLWYALYYKNVLPAGANGEVTVFKNVTIPTTLTREQAAAFNGGFNVLVAADAVQTQNVGDNASAAFTTVGLSATATYDALIAKLNTP